MDDFFEDAQTQDTQIDKQNVQQNGFQGEQPLIIFQMRHQVNQLHQMHLSYNISQAQSPEQQQRKDKLRLLEDERIAQIKEKDQLERQLKQQKKQQGQEFLQEFKKQQETEIIQRRNQNKQQQEIWIENHKNHNQYKNSWDQIALNIALKDGEYPGEKDVTIMRQAILNKRSDLRK